MSRLTSILLQVNIKLRLPVVMSKFLQASPISTNDFVTQWKALAGPPTKLQEVVNHIILCQLFYVRRQHSKKHSDVVLYVCIL